MTTITTPIDIRRVRRIAAKLGCRITRDRSLVHTHSGRVLLSPTVIETIDRYVRSRTDGAFGKVGDHILNIGRENRITEDLWNSVVATGDEGYRLPYRVEVLLPSEAAARERLEQIRASVAEPFIWRIERLDVVTNEPGWKTYMGLVVGMGKTSAGVSAA